PSILVDQHPKRSVQSGGDVVLSHLEGEQWISHDVLNGFSLLPERREECSVVNCAKEHKATRTGHRLHLGLCLVGIGGKRLQHARVELAKLSLEVPCDLGKVLAGFQTNVSDEMGGNFHCCSSRNA